MPNMSILFASASRTELLFRCTAMYKQLWAGSVLPVSGTAVFM